MAIIPGTAKVLNQYENVNTTYGGSKAMKAQSKWYTMDDVIETINAEGGSGVTEIIAGDGISVDQSTGAVTVTNTVEPYVAPYTVFTALLTQSGGSAPVELTSGDLTIGVTYFIQLIEEADFSNVGGSNIEGTYFIATGTTPNSWGGGRLTANGGAPVATVLQNTLEGTISFHYVGEGNYVVVNSIPWDQTKTTFQLEQGFADFGSFVPSFVPITGDGKTFLTFSNTGTAGSTPPNILPPSNGILNKSLVEIKVYN